MSLFKRGRKWVVREAAKNLGLTMEEAGRRVDALLKSGILEEGSPEDKWTQMRIENFLRFDLNNLDYTAVFAATINFPELVKTYDEAEGQNLTKALRDIEGDTGDWQEIKEQIERFDKTFCRQIWNYFPNVQKFGQ